MRGNLVKKAVSKLDALTLLLMPSRILTLSALSHSVENHYSGEVFVQMLAMLTTLRPRAEAKQSPIHIEALQSSQAHINGALAHNLHVLPHLDDRSS